MARNKGVALEKLPEKMELKKHVAIIHSSSKLSLLQRKIANALLYNAYSNLQFQDEHTINIAKLCDIIGYQSNDHKTIKKSLVDLLSTVLQWNLVDGNKLDKEGVWNASSIIADASIDGSVCTYSYSNKMRQLLYRPSIYGRLDMHTQAMFKSTYGLALYENCNRFQDIGQTPWFDIEKFRLLMGVEKGKYKQFKDFKTRVLDKAVSEVNQFASFQIEVQVRRKNRQVTSIQFEIQNRILADKKNNRVGESDLKEKLAKDFCFSVKQISNVFEKYDEKYISEKIDLIESSTSFRNGRIKNVSRYLMKALSDDFKPAVKKERKSMIKSTVIEYKNETTSKVSLVEERTEYSRYQSKSAFEKVNALPDKEKNVLLRDFERILSGVYKTVYAREGIKNSLIQDQLYEYLKVKCKSLIEDLLDFEAWQNFSKL